MKLEGSVILVVLVAALGSSCTRNRTPVAKKTGGEKPGVVEPAPAETKPAPTNKPTDERKNPLYSQTRPNEDNKTDPSSLSSGSAQMIRLLNGWSGSEDIAPQGLTFKTQPLVAKESSAPDAETDPNSTPDSETDGPNSDPDGTSPGTFNALLAELQNQNCTGCHSPSGQVGSIPLDSHAGMMNNQTPKGYVGAIVSEVRSGSMPRGARNAPNVRSTNADKLAALITAWRDAGYPAQ